MPTIMAPLTPVQKAAVIVLRLSGNLANVWQLFKINRAPEPNHAVLAEYISPSGIKDTIVLSYFKAPFSYTGEDVLELSFHGNPLIVIEAMKDMAALGVRMAEAGEFTRRAYINGKMSIAQAEAVEALISAKNEDGLQLAQNALYGGLDESFYALRLELVSLLANLEADIDFAEEQDLDVRAGVAGLADKLSELIAGYETARMSIDGVRTVIAGAPNAGKSTLFNALLGQERAIVTPEAGTTRDVISEHVGMGGIVLTLTDTAGLRESNSEAESEGIRRAYENIKNADLVIIAVDMSDRETEKSLKALALSERKAIRVGTKCDLAKGDARNFDICISAKSGEGVAELKAMLSARAAELAKASGAGLISERQCLECKAALMELQPLLEEELSADLAAFYLRNAAKSLDRLKGQNIGEETLDMLFAKFCIGK